ncbi:LysE family translocator [Photobacterium sp. 1_MG-2023]|uniref:LysE family translocator n=1 Tax=Photobacterium sp. 1_MG-2023 TaxID=3062646 RepID=UPI0026E48B3E|nr:LysE family translocator [Photobacterium sp. 1_MG-2023]MDO6705306.1 LysE family translocator [Photobacterium sp. 1_MG-2023]
MENYLIFITVAIATIASPGPGVILTLSQAVRCGGRSAIPGIVGIAIGMLLLAMISSTSLVVLLAQSATILALLKYIGAAYLIYLGIKMLRSTSTLSIDEQVIAPRSIIRRFLEGVAITMLNPKPLFFFMALFPQFVHGEADHAMQLMILAVTFSVIVIVIHSLYAICAGKLKARLSEGKGQLWVTRAGGGCYLCFGAGLALSGQR